MRLLLGRRPSWFCYHLRADCGNAFTYWLSYAVAEPRDFTYSAPRRIACRLFGHHNATCRGRPDHPKR